MVGNLAGFANCAFADVDVRVIGPDEDDSRDCQRMRYCLARRGSQLTGSVYVGGHANRQSR